MERNPILLSQVLVPGVVAALGIPQRDKVLVLEEPTGEGQIDYLADPGVGPLPASDSLLAKCSLL